MGTRKILARLLYRSMPLFSVTTTISSVSIDQMRIHLGRKEWKLEWNTCSTDRRRTTIASSGSSLANKKFPVLPLSGYPVLTEQKKTFGEISNAKCVTK